MKNIFFRIVIGLALFISVADLHAQRKRQAQDSSVTIVFSERTTTGAKRKTAGDGNIVKIAPLGFIGGVFPLSYERRINDFITVEAAGGLTHRNYVRGAFVKEEGVDVKQYPWGAAAAGEDEAEPAYNYDYRTPKIGFTYRIMPKIYFEEEAPEGSYIGLQYNFLKYKFSIPKYQGTVLSGYSHSGAPVEEYENVTDYMVYFGRQIVNNRITVESASGIGLRQVNGTKYVATANGGSVKDGLAAYKQNTINLGIMFTLGYHF